MYLSRIKLVNFIGIYIGQRCETIEIKMNNLYPITLLRAQNSRGKTTLLSAMSSPYAYDGGIDNRSNTNIIRIGYTGEKEMEYEDGADHYFIHHYYKPNQNDSHSVKSYIAKNGVELNPNGNVSSYEQIIQSVFGIDQKDLLLSRLGTNTTSFSSMSSMDRKKYLSRIIGDIDSYMALFRDIQSDIRVNREMINKFTTEMGKLKIGNIDVFTQQRDDWKDRISQLLMAIGKTENELENISVEANQDPQELRSERDLLLHKISFGESLDPELKKTSVDSLRNQRSSLEVESNQLNNKINAIRASIDSNKRGIEFANMDLSKLEVDDTISDKIQILQQELDQLKSQYQKFHPSMTSNEFSVVYQRIGVIRTLMTVIIRYDSQIIRIMLGIYQKDQSIEEWIDQSMSTVVDLDTKQVMHQHVQQLLQNGYSLPDCRDVNCVYRKIGEMISVSDQSNTMTVDFIRSVQDVYKSYLSMLSEIHSLPSLPKQLSSIISQKNLDQLIQQGEIFSLDLFDQYQRTLIGYESYQQKLQQMNMYKEQESSKKRLVILRGEAMKRIQDLTASNQPLESKLLLTKNDLAKCNERLSELDVKIGKRLEYDNLKTMLPSYKKRIREIEEKLDKINTLRPRSSLLEQQIRSFQEELQALQQKVSDADTSISLYTKYQSDIVSLGELIADQQKILRNVTPKDKGIPLLYMRRFFDKIRIQCNELLDITYDGDLKIGSFDPSTPTFNIPYIKNGILVQDVKLSSQGERPVIDIALEFAMSAAQGSKKYNILCCDELDSTLDYKKKQKYPEMLEMHISSMGIEQCFVISHSEVFNSIPTNVINLNQDDTASEGANIYEIIRS